VLWAGDSTPTFEYFGFPAVCGASSLEQIVLAESQRINQTPADWLHQHCSAEISEMPATPSS